MKTESKMAAKHFFYLFKIAKISIIQQLTPQHSLKMGENSLDSTFQESLAVGLNF
jgi:hypothetical protein